MRRVEHLLKTIRRGTDNEVNVTDTAGVSDEDLLEALNDAQTYLQQQLESINSDPFTQEIFIDSVAQQEAYTLPPRTYLTQDLVTVEYSATGPSSPVTYRKLRNIQLQERRNVQYGPLPNTYLLRNRQILLNPVPSTSVQSAIRINSVVQVAKLDKRRATINNWEIDSTSGALTSLSVETDDFTDFFPGSASFSDENILVDNLFSIVDENGVIVARDLPILRIITEDVANAVNEPGDCLLGTYTPEIAVVLDSSTIYYLVAGPNSTTHSEMPDACESYLIQWGKWSLLERDGHYSESSKQLDRLLKIEENLKNAWSRISDDVQYIPILNKDYLFS